MEKDYRRKIDGKLASLALRALKLSAPTPRFIGQLATFALGQRKASVRRRAAEARGVLVPAFMALSVTHSCNLSCAGCYARALHKPKGRELGTEEWVGLLRQASDLGVSVVTVLGGEPFTRPDLFDIIGEFPGILFLVFTNGSLLDPATVERIGHLRNLVPMLSVEGFREETDRRRGKGVWEGVGTAAGRLKKAGILFGASITASRENLGAVTDTAFIRSLHGQGARVFFFVEFLPAQPGTEGSCLDADMKRRLSRSIDAARKEHCGVFFDFPGDEYLYGGCLSAGRGFIHVSPEGLYEPCPFSPYSDTSVRTHSLEEALDSPLFRGIRAIPEDQGGPDGACELWEKRGLVASLQASSAEAGADAPVGDQRSTISA